MKCRTVGCKRKAQPHHALCHSHVGLLIDRVIRGKA